MPTRLYSLFRRENVKGKRRYTRVEGAGAYRKADAVRIFQTELINSAFTSAPLELRPVKRDPAEDPVCHADKIPAAHLLCGPCAAHHHNRCNGGDCACGCRLFR